MVSFPEQHLHFNEARADGIALHQLDHMQIICTLLQTDNHARTSLVITHFFTGQMLFLTPNKQCQRTEGILYYNDIHNTAKHSLIMIETWFNNYIRLVVYSDTVAISQEYIRHKCTFIQNCNFSI